MSSIKNTLAAILDSKKFTDLNYQDWLRNLNIVLASEKLLYTIEKSPPKEAPADISPEELVTLKQWWDDELKTRCYVMASMSNEMQRRFEKTKYAADILVFLGVLPCWRLGAWLRPISRGNRHFTVGGGRLRQSGPRPEGRLLRQPALEGLTRSARTDSPRKVSRNKFRRGAAAAAMQGGGRRREVGGEVRRPKLRS
ncbi:hypothetical protein F511_31974 [Dorcoceras hygrometricum]|uniref:Uncharacterized protein n=1 Tax=Dorcoceras hygrometricum TaxID=472368 RepID=A0A2Z7BZT8_9LAMI|nr:hypothetical protein F511_31974 [Dorcoceras hygrometricum]